MNLSKVFSLLPNLFTNQTAIDNFISAGKIAFFLAVFKITLSTGVVYMVILQNISTGLIEHFAVYTEIPDGLIVANFLYDVVQPLISTGKEVGVHLYAQHVLRTVPFVTAFLSMGVLRSLYKPHDFKFPWQEKLFALTSKPMTGYDECSTFVRFFNALVRGSAVQPKSDIKPTYVSKKGASKSSVVASDTDSTQGKD